MHPFHGWRSSPSASPNPETGKRGCGDGPWIETSRFGRRGSGPIRRTSNLLILMEDQPYPPSYLALVSTKVRLLSDYLLVNRDEVAKRQWVFLSLCIHVGAWPRMLQQKKLRKVDPK